MRRVNSMSLKGHQAGEEILLILRDPEFSGELIGHFLMMEKEFTTPHLTSAGYGDCVLKLLWYLELHSGIADYETWPTL
ncbi:unnamed protein product [Cercopithifilaria johnstoni]|uniref:Uncharacterized protein n=1 Tax=Cercopithifilaria johnstoni TaxID=2874296 RepID=A0A8J2M036_9BILA|nr:unnamed protein product [Cercopithifilaria johnstoni]